MSEEFSIFRVFPTQEQAEELQALLKDNGIDAVVGDNLPPIDVTFSGSTAQHQYEVRIAPGDFKQAEAILASQAENLIETLDKDYYLFSFTDEELYDILLRADEWSDLDYALARQLLEQRGKPVDGQLLQSLKKQRLDDLAKPEGSQKTWIYVGYVFAILGGGLGIIIGYLIWKSKKTLPNGERVYSYSDQDRPKGKLLFIISLVLFIIYLILYSLPFVFLY